jgi:plastocyanin
MTRSLRYLAVTATVAALLAVACSSSDDSGSGSADTSSGATSAGDRSYGGAATEAPAAASTAAPGATAAGGAAPAAAGDGAVTIKDFAFDPADASVAVGTTVTWTNDDSPKHRIKSGDGSFDGEDLATGDTFEHTFDTAGTFDYVCGIHPTMKGTITVTG